MNPEVKEKWITALESGEYPKIEGRLRSSAGYCSLGVLGDLAVREGLAEWTTEDVHCCTCCTSRTQFLIKTGLHMDMSILPSAVTQWAGLTTRNQADIFDFNDDWHGTNIPVSFHDMAIWIKENL